jgi:hypothetical protein
MNPTSVLVVGATFLLTATLARSEAPTFLKDVAPILYENCVSCHRPGEIGPMPLRTYEEVRPWARAIQSTVQTREMPPWLADPGNTLPMHNERLLSAEEIAILSAWADGGAPRGEGEPPPLPELVEGWTVGREPDFVFELPVEYEIPAEGEEEYLDFYVPVPFEEDRFAEILEMRPGNRAVVHHCGAFVVDLPEGARVVDGKLVNEAGEPLSRKEADALERARESEAAGRRTRQAVFNQVNLPGTSKLISFVPGRGVERHHPGTGKRIAAGKWVKFTMHYNSTGKPEKDRTKLGVWFNTKPVTHEVFTRQGGNPVPTDPDGHDIYIVNGVEYASDVDENGRRVRAEIPNIPPYAENWKIVGITPVTEDITLYGMSPHMHLRGKSLKWIVTWPDGREETILDVPEFDFNWQIHYELLEPLKIPAGSKITAVGIYDNSLLNRWNPGPHLEVYWGEQSWDEMYQAFTEYTIDSQDLTKAGPATENQP